jgi:tRNA (guanine37-N1)-methyltransferase
MHFEVITLFPNIINSYMAEGIVSKGVELGKVTYNATYLREFGEGNYQQVDDRVFGGGAGMVLMFEPMARAVAAAKANMRERGIEKYKVIALTAGGTRYKQSIAKNYLEGLEGMIILCGRYEGYDQRILEELVDEEVSIGNYVISGGELGALAIIDSIVRITPGVLNTEESFQTDSFFEDDQTVQHPQYTRPEKLEFEGKTLTVPPVLLSGNHAEIAKWRQSQLRAVE